MQPFFILHHWTRTNLIASSPHSKALIKPLFRQAHHRPLARETLKRRRSVHYNLRAYKYHQQAPQGSLHTSSSQPSVNSDNHQNQWYMSEIISQNIIFYFLALFPVTYNCNVYSVDLPIYLTQFVLKYSIKNKRKHQCWANINKSTKMYILVHASIFITTCLIKKNYTLDDFIFSYKTILSLIAKSTLNWVI